MKLIVVALALTGGVVLAAERTFTNGDGSNDIASATAWDGEGGLPGASDTVKFTGNKSYTVHASKDVTFGMLYNNLSQGYANWLELDLREAGADPVRTITLSGGFQMGTKAGAPNLYARFRGGIVDCGGKAFWNANSSTCYGDNRQVYLCDGVVVTNVGNVILGYTAQDRLILDLSGKSCLYGIGNFKFTNNKTAKGNENYLRVQGGSKMVLGTLTREDSVGNWANSLSNQPEGGLFYKDYILVSGEGSSLMFTNNTYHYLGCQGGSSTVVSDGGYLRLVGNTVLSTQYARNNLLRAERGGQIELNTFFGGWGGHGAGLQYHRVEVLEDSVFTGGGFFLGYVNQSGATLCVSNGSFTVNQFTLGTAPGGEPINATNELVLLQGPKARFTVLDPGTNGKYTMFPTHHSEYRVELGASFQPQTSFGWTTGASGNHDNTLRVREGGVLTNVAFSTAMENPDTGFACYNNRVIAESGAVVTGSYVNVQGSNCLFRVDNATVRLGSVLRVGRIDSYGGISTNCQLQVAGSRPSMTLGSLLVDASGCVRFELPETGYEEGVAPMTASGALTFRPGCTVEIAGAQALYDHLVAADERVEYVLMENPSGSEFVPDAAIAAAQAQLSGLFKLVKRVKDGKNQLVLKGGAPRGATILIR